MVSKIFLDDNKNEHVLEDVSKAKFRPGVYVLVKDFEDRVMLILNGGSGKWEIPGGGLEIGEDINECGIREVKEETGYDILIDESPFLIEKDLSYVPSGFEHCINFFYTGKLKEEKRGDQSFVEGEEILKVKFFSIDELKDLDICFWHENAIKAFLEK